MDSDQTNEIDQPRIATRMWGYDRLEVDALLTELRGRLAESERVVAEALPGVVELSGVGEKVEEILSQAREAAEIAGREASERAAQLSRAAEEEAEQLRREAEEHVTSTRAAADQYDAGVRAEADKAATERSEAARLEAEAAVAAAEEEAEQILGDARAEQARVEASIEELRGRRAAVIGEIEAIRGSLGSMVGAAEQGTIEFLGTEESAAGGEDAETQLLDSEVEGDELATYDEGDYDSREWVAAEDADAAEAEDDASYEDFEPEGGDGPRVFSPPEGDTEESPIRAEDL
ncbi:MAG: hypothetical protein WBB30_12080 [Solirubrobacterales bacterium]